MRPMSKLKHHIAACLFSLSPDADGAIQLFPSGQFDAPRGALRGKGPWKLDAQIAEQLISAVSKRQNDILIDYEHQSLLTANNGQPVPAAGWIDSSSLEYRDAPAAVTGLFATQVKWTGAASAHIAADEYRYLSPVFSYDAKTGAVLDIINVALTNNPAIDGMQAVTVAAASLLESTDLSNPPTENPMELDELLERLRYLFNLPTLATIDEIVAQMDKAKALLGTQSAATSLLDLIDAKTGEIAALSAQLANAGEIDPTQYAPIAVVNELRGKLAALSGDSVDMQVQKLIEQGVASGKIIGDAEKEWATKLGKKDIAALNNYLDNATGIAALSGMQTGGKAPVATEQTASLSASAEEVQVAKLLEIDPADIVKQRR